MRRASFARHDPSTTTPPRLASVSPRGIWSPSGRRPQRGDFVFDTPSDPSYNREVR
jgi:hypothetical protein